jgi:hypothetical protein
MADYVPGGFAIHHSLVIIRLDLDTNFAGYPMPILYAPQKALFLGLNPLSCSLLEKLLRLEC